MYLSVYTIYLYTYIYININKLEIHVAFLINFFFLTKITDNTFFFILFALLYIDKVI